MPCTRRPDAGNGAISERISRCQIRVKTDANGMTDDPVETGGLIPGTGGSNRIQNGSEKMTGERALTAGVVRTAGRPRIGEKGGNCCPGCQGIRNKLK